MKRIRAAYCLVLALFLFLALLSARREMYLLVAITLALPLLAALLHVCIHRTIWLEPRFLQAETVKGDQTFFIVNVHNRSIFPYTNIGVFVRLPYREKEMEMRCTVPPRTTSRIRIPVSCKYCGHYSGSVVRLRANDLFGLFTTSLPRRTLNRFPPAALVVLPRVADLPPFSVVRSGRQDQEPLSDALADLGDSFSDIRAYHAGDSMKRIHWPAAARQRELLVRVYDAPKDSTVTIYIDNSDRFFTGEQLLRYRDLACECAAAVAQAALLSGFGVTVINGNIPENPGAEAQRRSFTALPTDTRGLVMLRHHLARLTFAAPKEDTGIPEPPRTAGTKAAFVLSGAPDGPLYRQVRALYPQTITSVKQILLGYDANTQGKTESVLCLAFGDDLAVSLGGRIWE